MARRSFANHVPTSSHPLVGRIERKGGIVIAKSNTPEFGAGGTHLQRGVRAHAQSLEHLALTCGGSTGGGAVALATGEVWLAHGSDHARLAAPARHLLLGRRPASARRAG